MVVSVLLVTPVEAEWSEERYIILSSNIHATPPAYPDVTLISVAVVAHWKDGKPIDTIAEVFWLGDRFRLVAHQDPTPVVLSVDPHVTRATVTFPDGSSLVFHAVPGDSSTYLSDATYRGQIAVANHGVTRTIYRTTTNYGYVTGVLQDFAFDTRELESAAYENPMTLEVTRRQFMPPDPKPGRK
jgi:hypothetical protein